MRRSRQLIEQDLLKGGAASWVDPSTRRVHSIQLARPEQRRLFALLLRTSVRSASNLDQEFITNLKEALAGDGDPASEVKEVLVMEGSLRTWFLKRIETYGFGGVNSCYISRDSRPFSLDVNGESFCFEGPNSSGKSSLVGAITWALTGERAHDHSGPNAGVAEPYPVYGKDGSVLRSWPPVAAYPEDAATFPAIPRVGVRLVFEDPDTADEAVVKRALAKDAVQTEIDPRLAVADQLIEIGVLMPSRLQHLRFGEQGRLGAAIEALTGLDKLKELGEFVSGLCHGNQEFLRYAKRERQSEHEAAFKAALLAAKEKLPSATADFSLLKSLGTADLVNSLEQMKSAIEAKAADAFAVLREDVHGALDLRNPDEQKRVAASVLRARDDLKTGMKVLRVVEVLDRILQLLSNGQLDALATAIPAIESELAESLAWHGRQQKDTKLRLKVLAARWHKQFHKDCSQIDSCPLCGQGLQSVPELAEELTTLRAAGEAAEQTLREASARLYEKLWCAVPQEIRSDVEQAHRLRPKQDFLAELRERFLQERYVQVLIGVPNLVEQQLTLAANSLPEYCESLEATGASEELLAEAQNLVTLVRNARRLVDLGTWWGDHAATYQVFWQSLAGVPDSNLCYPPTTLNGYLTKLDEALTVAKPYQEAAEHLGKALTAAKRWYDINTEQSLRAQIAEALAPLKNLRALVEGEASDAVNSLSSKIDTILKRIYLIDRLKYRRTQVHRQAVTVQGGFGNSFNIDATLVANRSWLRAILWAFIFALREEAIESLGHNPFPLVLLDDPQSTFDIQHRRKWAEQIAAMNNLGAEDLQKSQFLIATYDTAFVDNLRTEGFKARFVRIDPINSETGNLTVIDGTELERLWRKVCQEQSGAAARVYIGQVRVHAETLMRLMLRGEGPVLPSPTWAPLRQKLQDLVEGGVPPYNRKVFVRLLGLLRPSVREVKLINRPHHCNEEDVGYAQAVDVEHYWRKQLGPCVSEAFETCRDFRSVNGELRALFASASTLQLPDGRKDAVRSIPLVLHGRAAAMTAGRAADGQLSVQDFPEFEREVYSLVNHGAYRLMSPTLEPVASAGDLLLVANAGEVHERNLVVTAVNGRTVARRFELADGKPEIAVLTAQSVNPYQISAPLVVHASSIDPLKIVGVLYELGNPVVRTGGPDEVTALEGDASIDVLSRDLLGLYKIEGRSAEPYALDGQYILVRKPLSSGERLKRLDGHMVLAVDDAGAHFFKRLRVLSNEVVLESLDLTGREKPILLAKGDGSAGIREVMEVAGILFELPQETVSDKRRPAAASALVSAGP